MPIMLIFKIIRRICPSSCGYQGDGGGYYEADGDEGRCGGGVDKRQEKSLIHCYCYCCYYYDYCYHYCYLTYLPCLTWCALWGPSFAAIATASREMHCADSA